MKERGNVAVWLYGSHARGNNDTVSDVDILVAAPGNLSEDELGCLVPQSYRESSITCYSWNELNGMAAYGSLFLQHLRLEGRPLFESEDCKGELARLLLALGSYAHAARDIRGFKAVLNDVADSISSGGTLCFELSVVATVIRHACILGCWLNGEPSFGRSEPVRKFVTQAALPVYLADEFAALYRFRMYFEGRLSQPSFHGVADVREWIARGHSLVSAVEARSNG